MSGHSKWAQIKRQKAGNDARKGQVFTKLAREITIAARQGVPDPENNFRLRLAVQRAREANMPQDNVERAIKRATGSGEGAALEELTYEGYAPGGAAILVQVTTDNRNRAASEVRNAFTRGGGNLGESGSVAWMFDPRGIITVDLDGKDADDLALAAIDAGADDVANDEGAVEVFTQPGDLDRVRQALEQAGYSISSAEQTMVPKTTMDLDDEAAVRVVKLMDRLEELDDVQKVYTNVELSEDVLASYGG